MNQPNTNPNTIEIPCITHKCLKYPTCKRKKFVVCTILREYCDDLTHLNTDQDIWQTLYEHFTELLGVQCDIPPEDSNITVARNVLVNKRKIPIDLIHMINDPLTVEWKE